MRILFLLLLLPAPALAWPPTFGPEFTFTNDEILSLFAKGPATSGDGEALLLKKLDRMRVLIEARCAASGDCVVDNGVVYFRVMYTDGFWIDVTRDPGVIEVTTKPGTVGEFHGQSARLQRDVFDLAAEAGMKPDRMAGDGHIHMGLNSAFGEDAKALRNMFADIANHPELAEGLWGFDPKNAPAMDHKKVTALQKVLKRFDDGLIETREELLGEIMVDVYKKEPGYPHLKYQALSLHSVKVPWTDRREKPMTQEEIKAYRLDNTATLEFRGFRPQKDVAMFLREIELLEARVKHLQGLPPVPVVLPSGSGDPYEAVAKFRRYVTEAGLDWNEYKKIMPVEWQMYSFPEPKAASCASAFRLVMPSRPIPGGQ